MLHLYSKGCQYALQVFMHLSPQERRAGFSMKSVCRRAGLPESFTRKIFQILAKHQVLAAKRGPGGGYRFKKNPDGISILSVIYAIDGEEAFDKCVLSDFKCRQTECCSIHPMWAKVKADLVSQLRRSTVAELIEEGGD